MKLYVLFGMDSPFCNLQQELIHMKLHVESACNRMC
jgi:hypothetical protein